MNENNFSYIPNELKSAVPGGAVAGADMIRDYKQGLTQEDINDIVLEKAVDVNLTVSSDIVDKGENAVNTISLVATTSIDADTIVIKKNGAVLEGGSGNGSRWPVTGSLGDSLGLSGDWTTYRAEFGKGDFSKSVEKKVATMYFGSGGDFNSFIAACKAKAVQSPAGSYAISVPTDGLYVWFAVPVTMRINKATKSGFDYPLESPVSVTIDNVAYKAYRSSNTYDAGTEDVVLS